MHKGRACQGPPLLPSGCSDILSVGGARHICLPVSKKRRKGQGAEASCLVLGGSHESLEQCVSPLGGGGAQLLPSSLMGPVSGAVGTCRVTSL